MEKKEFRRINKDNYGDYISSVSPKSKHFRNLIFAFIIGGSICTIGQIIIEIFAYNGVSRPEASGYASVILIIAAALLTGLGVYDRIGRFAGVGSTIPITGFSNAIVAPAIEYRCEGLIYGIGTRMFLVAGPVIVNGVAVATIIAIIKLLIL